MLLDTNILIDFHRKTNKEKSILWKIDPSITLYISTLTCFELLRGADTLNLKEEAIELIETFNIIDFTYDISVLASENEIIMNKSNHHIEEIDLFIGCTGIYKNIPVLTLNTKHFENIPNIILADLSLYLN